MDAEAVRAAYRRWAGVYDAVFGGVCLLAPDAAPWPWSTASPAATCWRSASAPALPCPITHADRRITGIDLSAEMLAQARKRVADRETRQRRGAARDGRRGDRFPRCLVRHRGGDVRRLGGAASARAAGGDAPGGAAGRQHPVRQPLRRRERAAVVDRARPGAGVARARLASGLRRGGAVRARGPRTHHGNAGAAVRHLQAGPSGA